MPTVEREVVHVRARVPSVQVERCRVRVRRRARARGRRKVGGVWLVSEGREHRGVLRVLRPRVLDPRRRRRRPGQEGERVGGTPFIEGGKRWRGARVVMAGEGGAAAHVDRALARRAA